MREIEFRGKRVDNGEWVYGYLYVGHNETHIMEKVASGFMSHIVNPETVGQFTGLKDKNGQKIYEGDIVRYVEVNKFVETTVYYHDGEVGYGCYIPFGNDMDSCMGSDVKVIGNIHDMKGEKE